MKQDKGTVPSAQTSEVFTHFEGALVNVVDEGPMGDVNVDSTDYSV